jgi:hypothetical protein
LITSPGPITGNMLERLKEQRVLKQRNIPSLHLWVLISILGDLLMIVCAEHAAYCKRHRNDHGNEVGTGCVGSQGCPTLWTTKSRF